MEGFGIEKLLLVLVIVLVLFGARRVPEIGASIGKGIREFKRGMNDLGADDTSESRPLDPPRESTTGSHATPPDERASEPKRLLGK